MTFSAPRGGVDNRYLCHKCGFTCNNAARTPKACFRCGYVHAMPDYLGTIPPKGQANTHKTVGRVAPDPTAAGRI